MERCLHILHILHRGHLIPSLDFSYSGNVELASSWVSALNALIRMSLHLLGTDEQAVANAFDWLESLDDEGAG